MNKTDVGLNLVPVQERISNNDVQLTESLMDAFNFYHYSS